MNAADKRQQVRDVLTDPLTRSNSLRSIANFVGVSVETVKQVKEEVAKDGFLYMKGIVETIEISKLQLDIGVQSRIKTDDAKVLEYAEAVRDGDKFPPIQVVFDGETYWVWDGFHRVPAHKKARRDKIAAEIRNGTRRDAVLLSVGANSDHGLPRSNADKRKAVTTLLVDEEWSQWSDRVIAKKTGTSNRFVGKVRSELEPTVNRSQSATRKGADGRTSNTSSIGKKKRTKCGNNQDASDSTEEEKELCDSSEETFLNQERASHEQSADIKFITIPVNNADQAAELIRKNFRVEQLIRLVRLLSNT